MPTTLEGARLRIRRCDSNSLDILRSSLGVRMELFPLSLASRVAEVVGAASFMNVFGDLLPADLDKLLFKAYRVWIHKALFNTLEVLAYKPV